MSTATGARLAQTAAAPLFALTMFFSAALIFVLQPMFARLTTPLLGGSPAVWNTSMVFFQAALLVGYAYAHGLTRVRSLRTQAIVHAIVLGLGCLVLPIAVSGALGQPNPAAPSAWLFGVLALSVGLPYAAASATAPLLQAWFARTGRADAADPYYLYAASNLGSLLGLIAYPIVLEPLLGLSAQTLAWSAGYVGLILFVVVCGFAAVLSGGGPAPTTPLAEGGAPLTALARWKQRGYWMAAAAAPSSLLLGVTAHISTDVASAPFLWVAPLALYLLTFVIAFAKTTQGLRGAAALLFPAMLAVLVFTFTYVGFVITLAAHLTAFFLAALVCHFALAQARPDAARLTEFYMYVSTGGVIGGALTALLAPVIFNDVFEYPIALAAAALFLPKVAGAMPRWVAMTLFLGVAAVATLYILDGVTAANTVVGADQNMTFLTSLFENNQTRMGLAVAVLGGLAIAASVVTVLSSTLALAAIGTLVLLTYFFTQGRYPGELVMFLSLAVTGAAIFANRGQPLLVAALVLVAFAMIRIDHATGRDVIFQERSFFGVTRVMRWQRPDGPVRVMVHGTTTHGAQYESGPRVAEPLTYYNPTTGLGFATQEALKQFPAAHLGLIGLGAGSSSCLRRATDTVTIYEIDPKVVRLSASKGMAGVFTFVPRCAPEAKIVIGDGRLSVAQEPDGSLDVLVVDAFSSDAVPAHLLTREAIRGYLQKLSPNGVVILHLSNRNLDLVGEASRVVQEEGLGALWANTVVFGTDDGDYTSYTTDTMVIGRTQAVVDALQLNETWAARFGDRPWEPIEKLDGRAWSDEYVNFIRPLLVMHGPTE